MSRRTRCLKAAIQRSVAGSVRSGASTLTSSSPETPVASWSLFRSRTSRRLCGASSRTSEYGFDLGPHPPADGRPGRDRRPGPGAGGLTDERSSRRVQSGPGARVGRPASGRARRGPRPVAQAQSGEARGQRQPEGDRDPDDEQQAEAPDHRRRREQQGEEAGAGRQAGDGDRRAAPRHGPASRLRPSGPGVDLLVVAGLELDRVVDREADQDRQHRDRGHRQRAAGDAEETEGRAPRRRARRRAAGAAAASGRPAPGPAPSPRRRRRAGPAGRPSATARGRR